MPSKHKDHQAADIDAESSDNDNDDEDEGEDNITMTGTGVTTAAPSESALKALLREFYKELECQMKMNGFYEESTVQHRQHGLQTSCRRH
jgi:hypothetical protein